MHYPIDKALDVVYGFSRGDLDAAHDSISITAENLLVEEIVVNHNIRKRNGNSYGELEIIFRTSTHDHRVVYALGRDWNGTMEQALKRYRPSLIPYLANRPEADRLCDLD